jgi:hypothetical protein
MTIQGERAPRPIGNALGDIGDLRDNERASALGNATESAIGVTEVVGLRIVLEGDMDKIDALGVIVPFIKGQGEIPYMI